MSAAPGALLLAALVLAGCLEGPTPEQIAAAEARVAEQDALSRAAIKPLVPVCLAALESGTPAAPAAMARLGYKVGMLGSWASTTGAVAMTVKFDGESCNFSTNSGALQGMGAEITTALEARGYSRDGTGKDMWSRGAQYSYTKGAVALALTGSSHYAYGVQTTLQLKRR
ncbi:hypothetical protein LPB142_11380 [Rhodobacter xanthinilyticus]|uniref:Lipoprotein n=1 Tax=Rhodobacter xanthinilyticus TaxID=1850250 RepID=A0A1D9MDC3_9RHOB|nr:hypothetical protein [Rhodobacter xanthinilyticus]AOZ69846.1 hypothetical protein LPB142_11380 [Rhodobacter xanthinilyticus]